MTTRTDLDDIGELPIEELRERVAERRRIQAAHAGELERHVAQTNAIAAARGPGNICVDQGCVCCTDPPEPVRSCNRHTDCAAADREWLVREGLDPITDYWRLPFDRHCHDDCCEDCFGQ